MSKCAFEINNLMRYYDFEINRKMKTLFLSLVTILESS